MKRRELIALLGGAAATWPLAARTQPSGKVARIGWMGRGNPGMSNPLQDAFREGMRELGYVETQSFVIEARYANGEAELVAQQAAELERSGVDVIHAGPFEALQAAKQHTSRVPIIMTPAADPVAAGIVASLERPGGNITGITEMMPQLTPLRLQLLKQISPALSRVAILWSPGTLSDGTFSQTLTAVRNAAQSLGVQVQVVEASKVDNFDAAFTAMAKERAEGLIVLVNPLFAFNGKRIIESANNLKLPAIHEWKGFVRNGGLISYGADLADIYRRTAGLVDKILRGAKPSDLSVEGPKKIEMSVSIKAASALGLTIPDVILQRADEVVK